MRWPARLEWIAADVLVDAAHNGDGAAALAAALPELAAGRPVILLAGVVADKEAAPILEPLVPLAARVVLTRPRSPRAREPFELLPLATGATVVAEPLLALREARRIAAERGGIVVAAGSIFLVGALRAELCAEHEDPDSAQDPSSRQM